MSMRCSRKVGAGTKLVGLRLGKAKGFRATLSIGGMGWGITAKARRDLPKKKVGALIAAPTAEPKRQVVSADRQALCTLTECTPCFRTFGTKGVVPGSTFSPLWGCLTHR